MIDLLSKILPMVILLTFSQLIYLKIDKKFDITNKIRSNLKIEPEWQSLFCVFSLIVTLLFVGTLGMYVFEIPTIAYSILCGIITGTSIGMTNNMKIIKNA